MLYMCAFQVIKSARVMKKAVGYLIPYIQKEKEEREQEFKAMGCWDENVCSSFCLLVTCIRD